MPRRPTEQQREELQSLTAKALAVFDFFVDENQVFPGAKEFRVDLERASDEGNLRGMRMAWRDMLGWIQDLQSESRSRLKARLRSLGVSLDEENARLRDRIRRIRLKGKIRNEDEYREILEYLSDVEESLPGDELADLRRILVDYETAFRRIEGSR